MAGLGWVAGFIRSKGLSPAGIPTLAEFVGLGLVS